MYNYDIVAIFCCIDDFCIMYEESEKQHLIDTGKQRNRATTLTLAEMLTIMVIFHFGPCKNFKYFYKHFLPFKHAGDFKKFPTYERFVQLMPRLFIPLNVMLHCISGEKTGTYIVDSTRLPICDNKRISRNKVFKGLAQRGKTTMGWFYGLKLHLLINYKGQIMGLQITPGNIDDRAVVASMTKKLKGKLFGDKGYLSKKLFLELYRRGLKLITGIRKNMKNYLMNFTEKLLLRKRFLIETIFGQLKIAMNLCHTRSRSTVNFFVNVLSCLTAYQLKTRSTRKCKFLQISYP